MATTQKNGIASAASRLARASAPDTEPAICESLPHSRESVRTARAVTRSALAVWGVEESDSDGVLMVVSELVTNAVVHAEPPLCLHVAQSADHHTVCVTVADGGPAPVGPASHASFPGDEHGRGQDIVASLAMNTDFSEGEHGAVRSAEVVAEASPCRISS
ncbi:hypothetical protein EES43_01285 [Streptomyces sp. ADI96-02]|uniref:ATP-binding protein n=1 Tax=unclassified Streptomyces TaxID=2593676 RepID=UPI000F54D72E|nr:ATP-binding protein [Streptomyces sp. ADI96-02]RPK68826.1 hypothetical protein EES43_01285 [Streptomyces sp. ADI96-02]